MSADVRNLLGCPVIICFDVSEDLRSNPFKMPKRRVRPDPVSCESCRTKKLKCSRVEPCSNCAARGIACRFLVPPKSAVSATSLDPPLSSRLERLESIVGSLQRQFYMINKPASSLPTTASYSGSQTHGDQVNSRVQEYANDLENLGTRDDTLVSNPKFNEIAPRSQL